MLGISHLLQDPNATAGKKEHFAQEVRSRGQIWRQMSCPTPCPQLFAGSVAFWRLGCEGRGQQEANRQTVLLHPHVSEDGRGSSLDVLTTFYFETHFFFTFI